MQINFSGPLNSLGYGVVSANLATALSKIADVSLFPIGNIDSTCYDKELLVKLIKNQSNFDPNAPTIKIYHQFALAERIGNGPYYAYPFFELTKFSEAALIHLRTPHVLLSASHWGKTILENETKKPVEVLPCGVNTDIFYPAEQQQKENRPYTFLNIGKWEKRKGHDILIRCFDKAFERSDSVQLAMLPYNPFLNEAQTAYWYKMYGSSKLASKITIYNAQATHQDMAKLMNECDCGIFPNRGEGWCLPLLETMACGKSVITTNYSGHTEFCNSKNSYLVDTPNLEDAYDGIWFFGEGQWAELDMDQEEQIIEYMRYCYKERPTNPAGPLTAKKFSWEKSAKKLLKILKNT